MSVLREILSTPPSQAHNLNALIKSKFMPNAPSASINSNNKSSKSDFLELPSTSTYNGSPQAMAEEQGVANEEIALANENELLRSTLKQCMLQLDHRTSIQIISEVLMEIIKQKRNGALSFVSNNEISRSAGRKNTQKLRSETEAESLVSNVKHVTAKSKPNSNGDHSVLFKKQVPMEKFAKKSSKHNNSIYYPSIRCILCREWVCIRNKIAHIESHFRYRPYKCNTCEYANRKEIFVTLHIQNVHNGNATVITKKEASIENEVTRLAEECVAYTETVLAAKSKTDDNQCQYYKDDELTRSNDLRLLLDQFPALSNCLNAENSLSVLENFHPRVSNARREAKNAMFEEAKRARIIHQIFSPESWPTQINEELSNKTI